MENSNPSRADRDGSFAGGQASRFPRVDEKLSASGSPRGSRAGLRCFIPLYRASVFQRGGPGDSGVSSPCEAPFLCLLARSSELSTRLPQIREYCCHARRPENGKNFSSFSLCFSFLFFLFLFHSWNLERRRIPIASVYVCACAHRPSSLGN